MNLKFFWGVVAAALLLLTSCDENTSQFGETLTDNEDNLSVSFATFNAYSRSVPVNSVIARTTQGYLGRIKDPETGALITGDYMTQFNCLEGYRIGPIDSIASRDENGQIIADSCLVRLFYRNFYGDSLATMKMTLYELDHPMLENTNYYSSFSPLDEGYVRKNGLCKTHVFSMVNKTEAKVKNSTNEYINNICVRLNDPYTDKNGNTYNNFGTYILRTYYAHPEYFKNSKAFTRNVIPGFFFKMNGGLGAIAYVAVPQLNIYYRGYLKPDSISSRYTLFSGTEEVLQTTTVTNDPQVINQLVSDNSCTYVKGPAGIFTEVTLPVDEVFKGHEHDSINTAKMMLYRINNSQVSDYLLPSASSLLMVESDSVNAFFEASKLANSKNSYLANFSSSTNRYAFNNIGKLLTTLYRKKTEGCKNDPQWMEKHPNWNKVMIIPVSTNYVTYNSNSVLTQVANDMTLTSTRLRGGQTPLVIDVIYSKFD